MVDAPKRRWFRFRLRTVFVAFTVCVLVFGFGRTIKRVRDRRAILDNRLHYHEVGPEIHIPWLQRALGDVPIDMIIAHRAITDAEHQRLCELFPEAYVARGVRSVPPRR